MSDKFEKGAENTILQMATLQRFPALINGRCLQRGH